MIRVGITGQSGFVGGHLFKKLGEYPDKYERIAFEDSFFYQENKLRDFVCKCDVIIHLAALVRSETKGKVYDTNILLGNKLINAMIEGNVSPCIMFASSVQEFDDTEYGRCKKDTRTQLSRWAEQHNTGFAGMIFPNLYGPNAKPNYHSFIATFCYKLTHNEEPVILVDNNISLLYIGNLVEQLLFTIDDLYKLNFNKSIRFQPDFTMKVSEVLNLLNYFKQSYLKECRLPELTTDVEKNLFDTFKSYINYQI